MVEELKREIREVQREKEQIKAAFGESSSKVEQWRARCLQIEPELGEVTKKNIHLEELASLKHRLKLDLPWKS